MKSIFLTGGSGVLGRALREHFDHATLFCLVHRTPIAASNVVSLAGDISRPRLGLTRSEYAELTGRIDLVIHAAAVTDFDQPPDVMSRTNIDGTRNVLELAGAANAPLYYVGTAFSEGPGYDGVIGANAYQESKRAAEALVRSSGVPSVILRPSIIIGDSQTGSIGRFQGFHSIVKLLCQELLPFGVAAPDCYLDLMPQDVVARIVAALAERGDNSGEYWLTWGDRALTVQRVLDLCVEHVSHLTRRQIRPPRAYSLDVFERLIKPVFLPALPPDIRSTLDRALQFTKYFHIDAPFPSSLAALETELDIGPLPAPELTLVRNLEYFARHGDVARLEG